MTTERTAIRRRLAVGRTAHRPPWGGRKAGHRSIVAPLAATVAATVALGVGIAIARADRERRGARQRLFDRRLALAPGERLADGLARMGLGQVDLALGMLDSAPIVGAPDEHAVHETRKALKRLRALLRLLEHALGEKAFARDNAALRDTAQRLSQARDAEVMLSTLDALIERHPRKLAKRGSVAKLRRRLLAEHARLQRQTLGDPATRAQMLGELEDFRARVAAWRLPDRDGLELIEADLRRLYRQGRKRHLRLSRAGAKGAASDARELHEWRKRVKDLRYAAEMLEHRDPQRGDGHNGTSRRRAKRRRKRARKDSQRLRLLARRADELGELLGEDHDLAVLAEHIRAGRGRGGQQTWRLGRRARKTLLALIAKRRRKLRTRALRDGARLYRARPSKFISRVRAAHASGARAHR
jgi:CHAD domain-containing protein